MKPEWLKRIASVIPLEYLGLLVGLFVLFESIFLIKEQNDRIIEAQAESAALYELVMTADAAVIHSTEAIVLGKRFLGSRSTGEHRDYLQALDSARGLFVSLDGDVSEVQKHGAENFDLILFKKILSKVEARLEFFDGILRSGRSLQVDAESNLAVVFQAHEELTIHVSRWLRARNDEIREMVAVNYQRLLFGMIVPLLFFALSFVLLRNKILTVRRYSAELERETRRVQQAEQVKSEFLANMSHEIRTPMTAILGFSELLKDAVNEPRHRGYLDGISAAGNTLLTLINDILDFSKIQAGHMTLKPKLMVLQNLMQKLDLLFRPIAERKRLGFTVRVEGDAATPLLLDEDRLHQILMNLVSNAVKFTQQGSVSVRARVDGAPGSRTLTVAVEDTGIGIAQGNLELIFEPFRQVEGSSTRSYGGTGLGLSISRKLASLMGGSITVASSESSGSVFTLTVPEASTSASDAAVEAPGDGASSSVDLPRLKGGTVLLVDDDQDSLAVLQGFLEGHKVRVLSARDGFEAFGILGTETVDLMVTDIMMPNLSGAELVARIRKSSRLRSLPVIVASASVPRDDLQPLMETTQGFLKKPFRRADFLGSLARHLPHEKPISGTLGRPQGAGKTLLDAFRTFRGDGTALRALAEDRIRPILRTLRITFSLDGMAGMGRELEDAGRKLDFPTLADFGRRLLAATENLDIGELNRLLEELDDFTAFLAAPEGGA